MWLVKTSQNSPAWTTLLYCFFMYFIFAILLLCSQCFNTFAKVRKEWGKVLCSFIYFVFAYLCSVSGLNSVYLPQSSNNWQLLRIPTWWAICPLAGSRLVGVLPDCYIPLPEQQRRRSCYIVRSLFPASSPTRKMYYNTYSKIKEIALKCFRPVACESVTLAVRCSNKCLVCCIPSEPVSVWGCWRSPHLLFTLQIYELFSILANFYSFFVCFLNFFYLLKHFFPFKEIVVLLHKYI